MLNILPSLAYAISLVILLLLSKKFAHANKGFFENQNTLENSLAFSNASNQDLSHEAINNHSRQNYPLHFQSHFAILILLILHGYVCFKDILTPGGIVFGFAQALSLMAWVCVALYWIEGWFFRLNGMLPMILVMAMWASFLPTIFPGVVISSKTVHSPGFILHFITANIAYGIMFLAALQAVLISWQERNLRASYGAKTSAQWSVSKVLLLGQKKAFLEQLPPLITMEKVLFNVLGIGFVLLTIAVFSGVFFSQELFGRPLTFDHKTFFSLLSWFMFGGLLFANWKFGLRGTQALKWIIGSFTALLLSYIGSRFVLEVILNRVH